MSSRALVFLSLIIGMIPLPATGQERQVHAPGLKVTIAAEKTRISAEEPLIVHVEFWNEGEDPVFVCRELSAAVNDVCQIRLEVFENGTLDAPKNGLIIDRTPSYSEDNPRKPPLAGELPKWWVLLSNQDWGYFYGSLHQYKSDYLGLRPGKYTIKVVYKTDGFLSRSSNNPLRGYSTELAQLPYKAWVGEVESNSIEIEVVPADEGRR